MPDGQRDRISADAPKRQAYELRVTWEPPADSALKRIVQGENNPGVRVTFGAVTAASVRPEGIRFDGVAVADPVINTATTV